MGHKIISQSRIGDTAKRAAFIVFLAIASCGDGKAILGPDAGPDLDRTIVDRGKGLPPYNLKSSDVGREASPFTKDKKEPTTDGKPALNVSDGGVARDAMRDASSDR